MDEKNNKKESANSTLSASVKTNVRVEETGTFYERTFITFENEHSFLDVFKKSIQQRPPLKPLCAITR